MVGVQPHHRGAARHNGRVGGHHVFISYSRSDVDYAAALALHLEEQGLDVWRDVDDVPVATPSYRKAIQNAIKQSAALIVIMTPAADGSAWVENEIEEARDTHKPIFPLLLEGTPLFGLKGTQFEQVGPGRMPSAKFTELLRDAVAAARARDPGHTAPLPVVDDGSPPPTTDHDTPTPTVDHDTPPPTTDEHTPTPTVDHDTPPPTTDEHTPAPPEEQLPPTPRPGPGPDPNRTLKILVGVAVVVVVVAAAAIGIVALTGGGDDDAQQEGSETESTETEGTAADGTVPAHLEAEVGLDPRSMALGFDSLWVAMTGEDSVWRLDPATLEVEETIDVGGDPQDVAVAPTAVWVSNTADGTVQRIEPTDNSVDEPIPVDDQPFGIYATSDTLWVAHVGGRSVVGVDLASGEAAQRISFDAFLTDVIERDGVLWVASWVDDDRIWRVPLDDPVPTVLDVGTEGANPQFLAAHDDYVFALFRGTGELARYTPDGSLDASVTPPGPPTAITVEGNSVLVGVDLDGGASTEVIRYDAVTLEPTDELTAADRTFGLGAEGSAVWLVLNRGAEDPGVVWREERPS